MVLDVVYLPYSLYIMIGLLSLCRMRVLVSRISEKSTPPEKNGIHEIISVEGSIPSFGTNQHI